MTDENTISQWVEIATSTPGDLVEDVPVIAAETDRPEAEDRNRAVIALSRIAKEYPAPVADVRPALVQRLSDEHDAVRYNAALALERVGRSHPDRLLGALEPIAERLGDTSPDAQDQSGDVLATVADEYPAEVEDSIATVLDELVADFRAEDPVKRNTAALGFVEAATVTEAVVVPYLDELVELFADDATAPRYHATMAVKRVATRDATAVTDIVEPLAAQLADDDEDVRDIAMHALAAIAEPEPDAIVGVLPSVGEALRDDNGEVRRYAAQAVASLAETHTAAVTPYVVPLVKTLGEGPAEATENAAVALHLLVESDDDAVKTAFEEVGIALDDDLHALVEAVRNDERDVPVRARTDDGSPQDDDVVDEFLEEADEILEGNLTDDNTVAGPDYEEDDSITLVTSDDTCAYRRDVDGDTWRCPHEPMDNTDFCLFHAPIAQKDDEAVTAALRDIAKSDGRRCKEVIGARFGDVDLSHKILASGDNYPLDIRHSHIAGELRCENISVRQPLQADGLTVAGTADFEAATFEGQTNFREATFRAAAFDRAAFERKADFTDAEFLGTLSFDRATFEAIAYFDRATFRDTLHFREVTLNRLDLDGTTCEADINMLKLAGETVRLNDATIHGHLNAAGAQITGSIRIEGLRINSDFTLSIASIDTIHGENVTIEGDLNFVGLSIERNLILNTSTVHGDLKLVDSTLNRLAITDCTVDGDVDIHNVQSRSSIRIEQSTIGSDLKLVSLRCEGKFHLLHTSIGNVDGHSLRISGGFICKESVISGDADFVRAHFQRRTSFLSTECNGSVDFTDATFDEDTKFREVLFRGPTTFEGAEFSESLVLSDTTFEDRATFSNTTITDAQFENTGVDGEGILDFEGATIFSGRISLPNERIVYDVTGARVGDIELKLHADSDSTLLDHFRFYNTRFDGFDFGAHRDELAMGGWRIHSTLDGFHFSTGPIDDVVELLEQRDSDEIAPEDVSSALGVEAKEAETLLNSADFKEAWFEEGEGGQLLPGQLENTYQKAKEDASDQGLNDIAAEFFLLEKRFKRKRHARRVRASNSAYTRTKGAFDWVSNLTMDALTGYGERPRNVIVSSVVTIGLFTCVYWVLNALPSGSRFSEYVLFSLQNFVTFIIGTRPQGTLTVRYVSAIEAFLGAFFVALFVFALTRSLNR